MGNEENSEIELVVQEQLECCVGGCLSKFEPTYKVTPLQLQSFHRIPKQPFGLRQAWINIIRGSRQEPEWFPAENSSVCSIHFHPADLQRYNNGENGSDGTSISKNFVPALRLTGLQTTETDEEIQIIKDCGVAFPLQVKEEPKSEEEEQDEEEELLPSDVSSNSRYWKKKGQRPKPTWSLKELSDEEGQNEEIHDDSSEYEPARDSDSDGEKKRKRKRQRVSRDKFGVTQSPRVSSSPSQLQQGQRRPSNTVIGVGYNHTMHHSPNLVNCSASAQQIVAPSSEPQKSGNIHVDHSNLMQWVKQLQDLHRTSLNEVDDYALSNSIFHKIYAYLMKFKSNDLTRTLLGQVDMLKDVVNRRKTQGNSIASQVHFTLVSKKIIEILESCTLTATPKRPSCPPLRKLNSNVTTQQAKVFQSNSPIVSGSTQGKPLLHTVCPPAKRNCEHPQGKTPIKATTEPPVVTIDDDDDDFCPTIESVTTLTDQQILDTRASSFDTFVAKIISGDVPAPAPDAEASRISWMNYAVDACVPDYVPPTLQKQQPDGMNHHPLSPYFVNTPIVAEPRKYPPNVPIVIDDLVVTRNYPTTAAPISQPVLTSYVSLNQVGSKAAPLSCNQVIPKQVPAALTNPTTSTNKPQLPNNALKPQSAASFSKKPEVKGQISQRVVESEIIVLSDSDDDCLVTSSTTPIRPPPQATQRQPPAHPINQNLNNSHNVKESGTAVMKKKSDEELVLGI